MRANSLGLIILCVGICLCSFLLENDCFGATYGGGSGDPNDPYQIWDTNDFTQIGMHPDDWDKYFILLSDIDLEGISDCNRIGIGFSDNFFSGVFDGNDHSISNWVYNTSEPIDYIGLFGTVRGPDAQIKNLTIINPNINAENAGEVAPLVGYLIQGKVTNCHVNGGTVTGKWLVGGLVGQNDYFGTDRGGIIERSSSSCRVEGTYTNQTFAGGLVGLNNGKISNCFAIGNVSGFVYAGGLVGKNQKSIIPSESGNIDNSYALGNISGEDKVGGLIGSNSYGDVSYCYSAGTVEATSNKGGLVGEFFNALGGSFLNCFWDFENSGLLVSAAGTGLSTDDMMTQTPYSSEGWDFTSPVWSIYETNSYPYLSWQNVATGKYGGGSGNTKDPYRIFYGRHLDELGQNPEDWDKDFLLVKNVSLIDYPDDSFHIIGNDQVPFRGTFCGNFKQISNLSYVGNNNGNDIGLFGFIDGQDAVINDLTLINIIIQPVVDIPYWYYSGGMAGVLKRGTISNCTVTGGAISTAGDYCGGLVGYCEDATITNCHTSVYITGGGSGYAACGGLVGCFNEGLIQDCSASGSVYTNQNWSGGLVGRNYGEIVRCFGSGNVTNTTAVCGGLVGENRGVIEQCFAEGNVSATSNVGGLIGKNYGTVTNCYSSGNVNSSTTYAGGLIGRNSSSKVSYCYSAGTFTDPSSSGVGGLCGPSSYSNLVENCYWDTEVSGVTTSDQGEGLTTSEMKQMISFKGFASDSVWVINEGIDYPRLVWGNTPGELIYACWYESGIGSEEAPYLIQSVNQFEAFSQIPSDSDKHFLLTSDIDMTGITNFNVNYFSGVFDGNGHIISNYISTDEALFAEIENATISNLVLENPQVDNADSILAARMNGGVINNCKIINGSLNTIYKAALLVGHNESGLIVDCAAEGAVISSSSEYNQYTYGGVGGIVAENYGQVKRCSSAGSVISNYLPVGGLVGRNYAMIENSYSSMNVQGSKSAGGLVGHNYAGIVNSYSIGNVSSLSVELVGGLVAYSANDALALNSFWDIDTSDVSVSSGGTGLSTTQMKKSNTYVTWGGTTWKIDNHKDYPRLFWEDSAGDPIEKLPYAGGVGTQEDPYQIASAQQLYYLSMYYEDWDKQIELLNDIDFSELDDPTVCSLGYEPIPFSGNFDGNGFSIINFNISDTNVGYGGLFRHVDGEQASISNITISNPNLTLEYCSMLIGTLKQGTVDNCHVAGGSITLTAATTSMGGLVGYNSSGGIIRNSSSSVSISFAGGGGGLASGNTGIIENCYSACDITATGGAGGLVGSNSGQLRNSYFTGNVISTGNKVGGVAGSNYGSIRNCYAQGAVSGDQYVGGLVGYCRDLTDVLLYHSYAACQVTGNLYLGGAVGRKYSTMVDRCYWDTDVCDIQVDEGAIGLTTSQMQQAASFEWGCDPVWTIDEENDYPRLWWEGSSGQTLTTGVYGGGCGTEENPFLITSVEELNQIGSNPGDLGGKFELLSDLDMSVLTPQEYNMIGNNTFQFSGVFEGNGHEIRNLSIVSEDTAVGLFSRTNGDSEIRNITLIDPNIMAPSSAYVGSLAGVSGSTIENCSVRNGHIAGHGYVGGLIGSNNGNLKNSFSSACVVEGSDRIGGLAGANSSMIKDCFSNSIINGTSYLGGLVGYGNYHSIIQDSYAQTTVNGENYLGGLVGYAVESSVISSYALGQVIGIDYIGGLVGDIGKQTLVDKCHAIVDVHGANRVGGLIGYMFWESTINSSYSKSNVNGEQYVGGLVGYAYEPYDSWHHIRDCYSNSNVQGNMDVGGFIGYDNSLYFHDCYSSSNVQGSTNVGGFAGSGSGSWFFDCFWDSSTNAGLGDQGDGPDLEGITAHNTETMQLASTYLDSGWDFMDEEANGTRDIWAICDGTNYPRLSWQEAPMGDFVCPDGVALEDYAYLSQYWLENCNEANNYCDGVDLDDMGSVGLEDMLLFCENWLAGVK